MRKIAYFFVFFLLIIKFSSCISLVGNASSTTRNLKFTTVKQDYQFVTESEVKLHIIVEYEVNSKGHIYNKNEYEGDGFKNLARMLITFKNISDKPFDGNENTNNNLLIEYELSDGSRHQNTVRLPYFLNPGITSQKGASFHPKNGVYCVGIKLLGLTSKNI